MKTILVYAVRDMLLSIRFLVSLEIQIVCVFVVAALAINRPTSFQGKAIDPIRRAYTHTHQILQIEAGAYADHMDLSHLTP